MPNDKILTGTKFTPSLKKIKASSSFGLTLSKILKSNNLNYILLENPKALQMTAAVLAKISGKNFFWIQNFHNPPVLNFFSMILLARADRIIVKSKRDINKLKSWGITKSKIHYQK